MRKKTNIPIMYCFDTNYVIPAAAAFYSLLEHASKDYDYTFYVLHSDITERQQDKLKETIQQFDNCKLEFIDMNHRFDDLWGKIYKGGHFSKEVMYKLLVSSIFPKLDKIIVSDVDVVFLNDISESFFELTDKDDAYIAGVKPIGKIKGYLDNYAPDWTKEEISMMGNVCGGYLVMNLKKIREDNYEQVFLDYFQNNGYRLNQMEQDIFNITCHGKIKHLHLKYVACSYMWDYYKTDEDKLTDCNYTKEEIDEAMNNPVQLHYATSIKPWKNVDCTKSDEWFKYIMKTPFAQEFLNDLPNKIVIPEERIVGIKKTKESLKSRLGKTKVGRVIKMIIKKPTMLFTKEFWKKVLRKIKKKEYSFLVFDDTFPSARSPFRYEEFIKYSLDNYNTYFAVTGASLPALKEYRHISDVITEFVENNPHFYNRIIDVSEPNRKEKLEELKKIKNPIAIFVFEKNIIGDLYDNLSFLEENNIPFVFTLYPGGGFVINDKESDKNLQRIFNSHCFKKVIVTQKNVKEYLLNKKYCSEDKIEMIFGVVTPEKTLKKHKSKKYYPLKENIGICFVAHKYSKLGEDKGYDLFVETAKRICKLHDNVTFDVVGDFDNKTIDVKEIENRITFNGDLSTEELIKIYKRNDIILSPTRPFVLNKGSFDGFPTGATTEAMINGLLAVTTDELCLNYVFDEDEIIIVKPNVEDILEKIENIICNPRMLKSIAKKGEKKARKIYSYKSQLKNRIELINELAKEYYNKN